MLRRSRQASRSTGPFFDALTSATPMRGRFTQPPRSCAVLSCERFSPYFSHTFGMVSSPAS